MRQQLFELVHYIKNDKETQPNIKISPDKNKKKIKSEEKNFKNYSKSKTLKFFLRLIQILLSERHTQTKHDFFVSASNVDFLKAHIKISFLYNFEKFWTSLL